MAPNQARMPTAQEFAQLKAMFAGATQGSTLQAADGPSAPALARAADMHAHEHVLQATSQEPFQVALRTRADYSKLREMFGPEVAARLATSASGKTLADVGLSADAASGPMEAAGVMTGSATTQRSLRKNRPMFAEAHALQGSSLWRELSPETQQYIQKLSAGTADEVLGSIATKLQADPTLAVPYTPNRRNNATMSGKEALQNVLERKWIPVMHLPPNMQRAFPGETMIDTTKLSADERSVLQSLTMPAFQAELDSRAHAPRIPDELAGRPELSPTASDAEVVTPSDAEKRANPDQATPDENV